MVANVNNVEVLVDLPFILMLKDFAMVSIKPLTAPLDESNKTDQSESIEVEDAGVSPSPMLVSPATSEMFSPAPSSTEASPTKSSEGSSSQGRVTIRAMIKKPVIALIEDAEDKNSRALVLSISKPNVAKPVRYHLFEWSILYHHMHCIVCFLRLVV